MNKDKFKGAIFAVALLVVGYLVGKSGSGDARAFGQQVTNGGWIAVSIPQGGGAAFKDVSSTSALSDFAYVVKADGSVVRARMDR